MAEMDIPQTEADALIAMEKHCVAKETWLFPQAGARLSVPLISLDKRENFILDITRGSIPAPVDRYPNPQDLFTAFEAFMAHCNITRLPRIEKGLFS